VRAAACDALKHIGLPVVEPIFQALNSEDVEFRNMISAVLENMRLGRLAPLIVYLKDDDIGIRKLAERFLTNDISSLLKALGDTNYLIRSRAIEALRSNSGTISESDKTDVKNALINVLNEEELMIGKIAYQLLKALESN
jgi:HEAT repeat protein